MFEIEVSVTSAFLIVAGKLQAAVFVLCAILCTVCC